MFSNWSILLGLYFVFTVVLKSLTVSHHLIQTQLFLFTCCELQQF